MVLEVADGATLGMDTNHCRTGQRAMPTVEVECR